MHFRLPQPTPLAAVLAAVLSTAAAPPSGEVVRHLTLSAILRPQASLEVSSRVLVFVVDQSGVATGSIDYVASARTMSTGEVLLSVECGDILSTAGTNPTATLVGAAEHSPIFPGTPSSAARWTGGGTRTGRLTFELRASPGTYVIPVRLSLTVP